MQIAACSEYRQKAEELFRNREGSVSPTHMQRGIVINPRALFNLLESNFLLALASSSPQEYYEVLLAARSSRQRFCPSSSF